ncbi:hypothetical protein MTR67_044627 [Solanum verrucosum]|uniref:Integrase catalytic domain-containing protein n=1 Tax=Solanum verrucosum TaxID=315347 RepID=A0AAF0ZT28_SOLVR|nr:hypothetical protein MTR67_044627 [Solanum verrucosum]
MVHNGSESSFVMDVKAKQGLDSILVELKEAVLKKSIKAFSQGGDGVLTYQGQLCVQNVGLPHTRRQHDSIWVIVDWMMKCTHFISIKVSYSTEDYAKLYLREMKGLGTKVKLSTIFHPQTNGQAERTNLQHSCHHSLPKPQLQPTWRHNQLPPLYIFAQKNS